AIDANESRTAARIARMRRTYHAASFDRAADLLRELVLGRSGWWRSSRTIPERDGARWGTSRSFGLAVAAGGDDRSRPHARTLAHHPRARGSTRRRRRVGGRSGLRVVDGRQRVRACLARPPWRRIPMVHAIHCW